MPSSTPDYDYSHSPPKGDDSSPPPPSKKKKSPSSSRRSGSNKKSRSDGDNSGAVIGAVIGGALLLLVVALLFVVCRKRRKPKPRRAAYYADDSFDYRDNKFFNYNQQKRITPKNNELLVKLPPEPPSGPQSSEMSSDYGWSIRPPPPPPMFSSEMSSAGFSSGPPQPPPPPSGALGLGQSTFRYQDLVTATNNFAKENLLGQGGFGYVYKGVLSNGKEVAVKYLKQNSWQGEREFQSEVEIISRVHHRHLVSLVGYCMAGTQRMLVYEFVPNGTLEYHLHGSGGPVMDWPTRLKIAIGAAKGFAYLHEDCGARIIHRDIKAANILVDMNFEAKVADFGLAKLSQDNYTHVSTRIMGTFGYLAPEYAASGKLTEKSDVYSFGIVLLELITGRRPIDRMNPDEDGLVDWARPYLINPAEVGSYQELIDPWLEDKYDSAEMYRMVHCAAACIRHTARRRPKMSQIVRALDADVSLDEVETAVQPSPGGMGSRTNSEYDLTNLGSSR